MSVIQVVSVYNDLSSLGRARATLHFLCREKEDGAGGEKNLKKADGERQTETEGPYGVS